MIINKNDKEGQQSQMKQNILREYATVSEKRKIKKEMIKYKMQILKRVTLN